MPPGKNGHDQAPSPQLAALIHAQYAGAQRRAPPVLGAATAPAPAAEGPQLSIGLDHAGGHVVLGFGAPISWMALLPGEARQLAEALGVFAERLEAAARGAPAPTTPTTPTEDTP